MLAAVELGCEVESTISAICRLPLREPMTSWADPMLFWMELTPVTAPV